MKTQLIKIVLLLFGLNYNLSYGQVDTKIDQISVNNQQYVNNCSTIDFGTTTNNSLTIYFTLTKPTNQAVGEGKLRFMLKYSNSSIGDMITEIPIQSISWSNNTQFTHVIGGNISSSSIQISGSSIYIEYESGSGSKYPSCEYPIIKTPQPTFTLSPSTLSLPCGDTGSRTFTVTPANIPAGGKRIL
jgi:hypothetical protein